MNRRHLSIMFPLFILTLAATLACAQDNYEIQVYGSDLVDPGHTMVELHSNFTIDGSKTIVDGVYPTNHAEHETVEITHGLNDWFECGFYIFTSITEGQSWQWVGDRARQTNARRRIYLEEVTASGNLGYALGTVAVRVRQNGGQEHGITFKYATIWRRDDDGLWRLVVDISNRNASL